MVLLCLYLKNQSNASLLRKRRKRKMRSIDSKYGLTYIMGDEIAFCETLKEFGTYYKSKMNERQVQIAEDLRKREIIKLVKLKDGQTGYKLYASTKRI